MRKLATIRQITQIDPIPGADNIVVATIDGWKCIVKKDEFKVNDFCIYFEIDSVLPNDNPHFAFMQSRKYRVKTIKLRGQISQGLALPLSIFPNQDRVRFLNEDVTEELKVTKYDPEAVQEQHETEQKNDWRKKNPVIKYLMRYQIFRKILSPKKKGSWPEFLSKTDEDRIQNIKWVLTEHKNEFVYYTEKMDGSSSSFFLKKEGKWFKKFEFGVCSRNIWLKVPDNSKWWEVAKRYDIEKKLRNIGQEYCIQGEICGPGIQKNKYELKELKLFVFNVFDIKNNKYLPLNELKDFCKMFGFEMVPILYAQGKMKETVDEMVKDSIGKSVINPKIQREGIVVRSVNDQRKLSFKVINPEFLLKYEE